MPRMSGRPRRTTRSRRWPDRRPTGFDRTLEPIIAGATRTTGMAPRREPPRRTKDRDEEAHPRHPDGRRRVLAAVRSPADGALATEAAMTTKTALVRQDATGLHPLPRHRTSRPSTRTVPWSKSEPRRPKRAARTQAKSQVEPESVATTARQQAQPVVVPQVGRRGRGPGEVRCQRLPGPARPALGLRSPEPVRISSRSSSDEVGGWLSGDVPASWKTPAKAIAAMSQGTFTQEVARSLAPDSEARVIFRRDAGDRRARRPVHPAPGRAEARLLAGSPGLDRQAVPQGSRRRADAAARRRPGRGPGRPGRDRGLHQGRRGDQGILHQPPSLPWPPPAWAPRAWPLTGTWLDGLIPTKGSATHGSHLLRGSSAWRPRSPSCT